ncbi:MAG: ribonuclease HIII [Deltaproteobacteria bacterium]|jgi:ribonuclease HIII|nr:ribonuclease HIII [Deltaproteobacteria bacterium]
MIVSIPYFVPREIAIENVREALKNRGLNAAEEELQGGAGLKFSFPSLKGASVNLYFRKKTGLSSAMVCYHLPEDMLGDFQALAKTAREDSPWKAAFPPFNPEPVDYPGEGGFFGPQPGEAGEADRLRDETVKCFGQGVYGFLSPGERVTLESGMGLLALARRAKPALPCHSPLLFPFAKAFKVFVARLLLLRLNVDMDKYQKDPREFPVEAYVYGKVLGRFIIGQAEDYHVLDRMAAVWESLRCLEAQVDPGDAVDPRRLDDLPRLESRVAEMAGVMRDAYRIFAQASSNDPDRSGYPIEPPDGGSPGQAFHSGMAGRPGGDPGPAGERGEAGRPDMARPSYPLYPRIETASALPGLGPVKPCRGRTPVKPIVVPKIRIGSDESGKGDYFGPLVVAGVYVNAELELRLSGLGVKDSKENSDNKNIALANEIKNVLGYRNFYVLRLNPGKYNQLYSRLNNLNDILAWGHVTVIENLLNRVECPYAIVDQFAEEGLIGRTLKAKGKDIEVFETPKGERDIAVAAASILAREAFLKTLAMLGMKYGLSLPKGSSHMVDRRIREIFDNYGPDALTGMAKVHFANTGKAGVVLA